MIQYGIYSINLERFIAIDFDLWVTMHTAKLLSSKMSLCVFKFISDLDINNTNCINFTLDNTWYVKQDSQYPRLINMDGDVYHIGLPLDIDLSVLDQHFKFCIRTLNIIKSAWITDAELNTSNRQYFQNLLEEIYLQGNPDDSGIEIGFLKSIDKILYLSNNILEVDEKLNKLFNDPNSIFVTNLKMYKLKFFETLNTYEK
jgi:hypothetical protein